jgi:AAA15 family ATPase/GTPase
MLIQFSVKNYKTFAEEVKLSMVASKDDTLKEKNVFSSGFGYDLLKSAVVYGANASGKSKLVEGMLFMKVLVLNSANFHSSKKIDVEPFKLSTVNEKEPSMFEVIFVYENEMYRYGFEVTTEKIVSEWLYVRQNNGKPKETELFYREEQKFEYNKTKFKVKSLIDNDRVKENTLLLSKADVENEKTAKKVFHWIYNVFNIMFTLKEEDIMYFKINNLLKEEDFKNEVVQLLQLADINVEDLHHANINIKDEINNLDDEDLQGIAGATINILDKNNIVYDANLYALHKKFNENKELTGFEYFDFFSGESAGTKKYLVIIAMSIIARDLGIILIVDELDAKLHPNLVCKIVALFNSNVTNPNNAQLIFNTHDTNLLSSGLFRRDQIWFTEKNHYGAADLYSLAEFKTDKVRKDDNFEKNYIEGRYGAIPYLGNFEKLFNQ